MRLLGQRSDLLLKKPGCMSFVFFPLFSSPSVPTQVMLNSLGKSCAHSVFVSQMRNLEFRKIQSFIMGVLSVMHNICPREKYDLHYPGQQQILPSVLEGNIIHPF